MWRLRKCGLIVWRHTHYMASKCGLTSNVASECDVKGNVASKCDIIQPIWTRCVSLKSLHDLKMLLNKQCGLKVWRLKQYGLKVWRLYQCGLEVLLHISNAACKCECIVTLVNWPQSVTSNKQCGLTFCHLASDMLWRNVTKLWNSNEPSAKRI